MRTFSVLMALALVALGGCTEAGDITPVQGDATGDGNTTNPPPTPGDGATDPGTNTPPVANLTADVLNGTAPLNITFTLNATDAEGDNLTWILAVNGTEVANGTELPATVVHNFTEPGNLTVLLRVFDGNATGDASLVVVVEAGIVEVAPEPVEVSLEWVGGPSACQIWLGDIEDIEYTRYTFPHDVTGLTLTLEYKTTAPGAHTRVAFWGASQISVHNEDSTDMSGTITATVPEGATYLRIGTCGPSGPSSGDLTIA